MKEIFKNENLTLKHDADKDLLVQHWYGELDELKYKSNMLEIVKLSDTGYNSKYNLIYPNLGFIITVELQAWSYENVLTKATRLEKVAFIVPESILEHMIEVMSMEQTMEEAESLYETRYFVTVEEAMQWLSD